MQTVFRMNSKRSYRRRSTRHINKPKLYEQKMKNNKTAKNKNGSTNSTVFIKEEEQETWSCEYCGKICKTLKLFREHERSHKAEDVKEEDSSSEYDNKEYIKKRIKKTKKQTKTENDPVYTPDPVKAEMPKIWSCKYCGEICETQKLLRDHKKSHKVEEIQEEDPSYKYDELQELYICQVCSAEFQKEPEAEQHVKSHLAGMKCLDCQEWFKSPYELGVHSLIHNENNKIKCPLCKYVSKSTNPYSFKAHLNYMHLKKFPFYCKECGKGFKQFKIYQEHQNTHTGTKPFICVVCEKPFTFEKYMLVHQVRNHQVGTSGNRIENECKRCHRYFKTSDALDEHIDDCIKKKKASKKPNSFLCDTCGQGFIEKAKLLKHIRVHVGDLPFACQWCGKKFPQKDYLKTHERVHTGEKPYSCDYCGKRFGFHAPFRVHLRTHTGERPYVCNFCVKGFTTNQGLKLHKKNCPDNQFYLVMN